MQIVVPFVKILANLGLFLRPSSHGIYDKSFALSYKMRSVLFNLSCPVKTPPVKMTTTMNSNTINVQLHWNPCNIFRRTNWLYRVDSLRIHDMREMQIYGMFVVFAKDMLLDLFSGYIVSKFLFKF